MTQRTETQHAPAPQPEHDEPKLATAGVGDLSTRDWFAIAKRAAKEMLDDDMTMIASALAYATSFAIPSVLLAALGVFTLVTGPGTINTVMQHLGHVMPAQATKDSLLRLDQKPSAGLTMTIVGLILAFSSMTSAMTSYMTALNLAYDRKEGRKFVTKRVTALAMVVCVGFAFFLIAGLLMFGPTIEKTVGDALGIQSVLKYVWWSAQWPILIAGLLASFATLLWLGPDVEHPRWQFLTIGSAIAVCDLADRVSRVRRLHVEVRDLQQDLGSTRGRDHHADLALGHLARAPLRRRVQRRSGAQPRTARGTARPARTTSAGSIRDVRSGVVSDLVAQ